MANITEEFLGSVGLLQISNGVALDSTLRAVTDQSNNVSTLYLSRTQVKIGSTLNDTPLSLFGTSNLFAIFNTSNIATSNKTFTFPNTSLTFAGIDIAQTFTADNTFSGANTFTVAQTFNNQVSAQSFRLTGTGGAGHLHLLFQSADPTLASATTTVLYGDNAGNLRLKNGANNRTTTFSTSANGQDSTYTFPNVASTTLAGLSVAQTFTAANIFSVSGATAVGAAMTLTGTPFVGTSTTSVPLFYLNGGTAPTTWDNTTTGGTYIGINSIANFAGNFIDFHKNGGSSLFKVDNTGTATISNINLGPSAGTGGILNLGNGGNGSAIQAAGLQVYNFSSRHRFDGDGTGSAFVGRVYIGGNSATNVSAQFQIDSTVRSFLPPRLSTGQQQFIGAAISAAGSGYVSGTYTNVPLTGGTGTSAQATIVVSSGAVSSVTITSFGSGYKVADVLSASNSNLGGAGSGFTYTLPSQPVGLVHYNTTLNKLVVYTGAITNNGWETITSV